MYIYYSIESHGDPQRVKGKKGKKERGVISMLHIFFKMDVSIVVRRKWL